MLRRMTTLATLGLILSITMQAHAQPAAEFTSGHGALQVFDGAGIASTPLWIKIWFAVLIATFAAGLAFVRRRVAARLAVSGFLLSVLLVSPIFGALGLPFLAGSISIAHLVGWTPALVVLLRRRPFLDTAEGRAYRVWSAAMTGVILFSFVFDIRDAAIYISHFASA